ncbi:MAG: hypothetical protein IJS32_00400 [Kiritimatiellae bacterium]|nr:hypothetical protein [Kiritimatiellia bacterium]
MGEGIIAIGEIPGIAEKLDELYVRLAAKAIRISGGTVEKTNFTSWPLKAGPEIFFQQFIQAIYDELQARLENVVNDLGICAFINKVFWEEKDDQGYPEMKGEITVKEYSFPAITKPWTWSTAPTIARSMFYEPCPDNCHWRVYYYVPLSTDLTTWNEIERFSCSGEPKCVKNACGSSR